MFDPLAITRQTNTPQGAPFRRVCVRRIEPAAALELFYDALRAEVRRPPIPPGARRRSDAWDGDLHLPGAQALEQH